MITDIDNPQQTYFNKIKINVEDIDEEDNPNTITIQIPENPTLNQQNVLENIDVETSNLITYNENDLDYGTTINIDLSRYRNYNIISQSNQWRTITTNNVQLTLADLFINYDPTANQLFSPNNTLTIQIPETMSVPKLTLNNIKTYNYYYDSNNYFTVLNKNVYKITQNNGSLTINGTPAKNGTADNVFVLLAFNKIFENNYIVDFLSGYNSRNYTGFSKGSYVIQLVTTATTPATNTMDSILKTIAIEDLKDSSIYIIGSSDGSGQNTSDITIYADLSELDNYVIN